jgi:hypothetical protein
VTITALEERMVQKLFADNVTLEIVQTKPGPKTVVVGYMFASSISTIGSTQQQRWVLYKEYSTNKGDEVVLKLPCSEDRKYDSLDAWKKAMALQGANGLWKEGATYSKVEATTSTQIAAPGVKALPATIGAQPKAPERHGAGSPHPKGPSDQLTTLPRWTPQLMDRVELTQKGVSVGLAYGTAWDAATIPVGGQQVNHETWVLLPAYKTTTPSAALKQSRSEGEGGGGGEMTIAFQRTGETLQDFIDEIEKDWKDGWTRIDAVCTYYQSPPLNDL